MKKTMNISISLASKLASAVVHADELTSPQGHQFDVDALRGIIKDPEVVAWLKSLGALAPVKRTKP